MEELDSYKYFPTDRSNSNNNSLKGSKSNRPSVEELRLKYLSMSKNMPKVRGVWFNSTPQRMGWVGQAYKKCKRIERIFSVNKYGFEGARKLAIAFRNSQKPANEDSDDDSWSKEDKINIKNCDENSNNYDYKNNFLVSMNTIKNNGSNIMSNDNNINNHSNNSNDNNHHMDNNLEAQIENNTDMIMDSNMDNDIDMNIDKKNIINKHNNHDENNKDMRINLCRDAILFILHDRSSSTFLL